MEWIVVILALVAFGALVWGYDRINREE